MDVRVISIGALDAHPLRNEQGAVRTGHGTTTLIRGERASIIVDPALPPEVLRARLDERTDLRHNQVTHVFLTSFRPDLRRGLPLFDHATWWIAEAEREAVGVPLIQQYQRAEESGEREIAATLAQEVAILKRCEHAPDTLAPGVDLFPLPGVTPGLSGLLLPEGRHTTLVCGDAIPTIEHLERGLAPRWAVDAARAKESFQDAIEIADLLVLGRDNMVVNPTKRPF
jgi:glyoxylase-like metal-dependent hydrolase (beta-lactamase superfamily II)